MLLPVVLLHRRDQRELDLLRGGEDGLKAEVIFLRDRVELVVVAAGTAHRQPQVGRTGHVGPVGQLFVAEPLGVEGRLVDDRAERVEAGAQARLEVAQLFVGGDINPFGIEIKVVGPKLIGGDLLLDEAVVRLVGVHRPDHVVAVAPCVAQIHVGLVATRVGVADDVKPVAAPTLTVLE